MRFPSARKLDFMMIKSVIVLTGSLLIAVIKSMAVIREMLNTVFLEALYKGDHVPQTNKGSSYSIKRRNLGALRPEEGEADQLR